MLEASTAGRAAAATEALGRHGHDRLLLDVAQADLRGVDAVWIAEPGDVDWSGENRLFPLMSVAIARGMPMLASGSGVRALVTAGLLPGEVLPGTGGTRQLHVVSDACAWGRFGPLIELPQNHEVGDGPGSDNVKQFGVLGRPISGDLYEYSPPFPGAELGPVDDPTHVDPHEPFGRDPSADGLVEA